MRNAGATTTMKLIITLMIVEPISLELCGVAASPSIPYQWSMHEPKVGHGRWKSKV